MGWMDGEVEEEEDILKQTTRTCRVIDVDVRFPVDPPRDTRELSPIIRSRHP